MGIDLKSGGRRTGHNVRKAPVTKNVYVKLLEKLYRWENKNGLQLVVLDLLVRWEAVRKIVATELIDGIICSLEVHDEIRKYIILY